MTPEEKLRTFFYMQTRDKADRALFDELVHGELVTIDMPAGVRVEGKEAHWAGIDLPPENKVGPGSFSYGAEFLGYSGDEQQGFANWSFRPTGAFAMLWGLKGIVIEEDDAPTIEIAIKVKFKDGKICQLEEFWNPVPWLQQLGVQIPTPTLANLG